MLRLGTTCQVYRNLGEVRHVKCNGPMRLPLSPSAKERVGPDTVEGMVSLYGRVSHCVLASDRSLYVQKMSLGLCNL